MIFEEQIARKPNHYPWTESFIEAMQNGFWTHRKFGFQSDIQDFKTVLTDEERELIKRTLSAIGQIEVAVKKFWARLGDNLPHPSLTDLGYVMANVEVIHNNAYERLLSVLDLEDVFEQNLQLDVVKGRVNYLKKYTHKFYESSKKQYVYALTLFTLFIENVSLFSQFYIILWFGRYKNVLKDTTQQVFYTKNEELLHAQAGIKIINTIREEHPELFDEELIERIRSEAENAYKAEAKLIDWMIGDYNDKFLSADILKGYVKNRLNESLTEIGMGTIFEIDKDEVLKDTIWMEETVFGNSKVDFFDRNSVDYEEHSKSFDADELF